MYFNSKLRPSSRQYWNNRTKLYLNVTHRLRRHLREKLKVHMGWVWISSHQSSRKRSTRMRPQSLLKLNIIVFSFSFFTFTITHLHYLSFILLLSPFRFDSVILCNLFAFLSFSAVLSCPLLCFALFLYISEALFHCRFQVSVSFIFCRLNSSFTLSPLFSHILPSVHSVSFWNNNHPSRAAGVHTVIYSWYADYAILCPPSEKTWPASLWRRKATSAEC